MSVLVCCPNCEKTLLELLNMSRDAYVDYHSCLTCGHIWTTLKGSGEVVGHVTKPTIATQRPSPNRA